MDAESTIPADTGGNGSADSQLPAGYRVLEMLGHGGMGVVYKVHEEALDREVAIKLLTAARMDDPAAIQRFQREARAMAAVNHPNIVTIHSVGEEGGNPFIVMEYVDGLSLGDLLARRGPLPPSQAVTIVRQAARGVAYAHDKGILHRDIKPGNILIDRRVKCVKVADFGLARLLGDVAPRLTVENTPVGTPYYMSPEQVRGRDIDKRSDVFSMGVVFYELLSGDLPFKGDTPLTTMHLIVDGEPVPLQVHRRDIPPEVVRIVEKAISRDKSERFQDMNEFAHALSDFRRTTGIPAPPASSARSRKPLLAAGLAAVIAVAALLGSWYFVGRPEAGPSTPDQAEPEAGAGSPELMASLLEAEFEASALYEESDRYTPDQKADRWRDFLETYGDDPSFDRQEYVQERILRWRRVAEGDAPGPPKETTGGEASAEKRLEKLLQTELKAAELLDRSPRFTPLQKLRTWKKIQSAYAGLPFYEQHQQKVTGRIKDWEEQARNLSGTARRPRAFLGEWENVNRTEGPIQAVAVTLNGLRLDVEVTTREGQKNTRATNLTDLADGEINLHWQARGAEWELVLQPLTAERLKATLTATRVGTTHEGARVETCYFRRKAPRLRRETGHGPAGTKGGAPELRAPVGR